MCSLLQHPRTWEAQFLSGIKVWPFIHIYMCTVQCSPLSFQTTESPFFIWFDSNSIIHIYIYIYLADHSPYCCKGRCCSIRSRSQGSLSLLLSLFYIFYINCTLTHSDSHHVLSTIFCLQKVIEDLSYVVLLRKKFSYIESIPGVLLPHPSSSAASYPSDKVEGSYNGPELQQWHFQGTTTSPQQAAHELYNHHDHHHFNNNNNMPLKITPSMSSLEALLSKLPSVVAPPTQTQQHHVLPPTPQQRPLEFMGGMAQKVAKEELDHDHEEVYRPELDMGESSSSMKGYHHFHNQHQQDHITGSGGANNGFWVVLVLITYIRLWKTEYGSICGWMKINQS